MARVLFWNRRYQSSLKQGCKESLHKLYSGSSPRKECVMNTVTTVQENAGDIYEAKNINEELDCGGRGGIRRCEATEAEDSTAENEATEEA